MDEEEISELNFPVYEPTNELEDFIFNEIPKLMVNSIKLDANIDEIIEETEMKMSLIGSRNNSNTMLQNINSGVRRISETDKLQNREDRNPLSFKTSNIFQTSFIDCDESFIICDRPKSSERGRQSERSRSNEITPEKKQDNMLFDSLHFGKRDSLTKINPKKKKDKMIFDSIFYVEREESHDSQIKAKVCCKCFVIIKHGNKSIENIHTNNGHKILEFYECTSKLRKEFESFSAYLPMFQLFSEKLEQIKKQYLLQGAKELKKEDKEADTLLWNLLFIEKRIEIELETLIAALESTKWNLFILKKILKIKEISELNNMLQEVNNNLEGMKYCFKKFSEKRFKKLQNSIEKENAINFAISELTKEIQDKCFEIANSE
jgi:hypothetical protein